MKGPKLMRRTDKASNKKMETEKNYIYNMSVCIFSIVLCLVSLSAVTWAWYTADVSSQENIIQSAAYRPNVGIYCVEEVVTLASDATEATTIEARIAKANGVGKLEYTLVKGKQYEVTVHASGDVKTGYYQITLGDKIYYTEQIAISRAMSFALSVDQDTEIKMTPLWGVSTQTVSLVDGGEYHVLAGELREGQGTLTDNDPSQQDPPSSEEPNDPTDTPNGEDDPDDAEGDLDPADPIEPTDTPNGTDDPDDAEGNLDPVDPVEPVEPTDTPNGTDDPDDGEGNLDPVDPVDPIEPTDTPNDEVTPDDDAEGNLEPVDPVDPIDPIDPTDTPNDEVTPDDSEGNLDPVEPTDTPSDSDVTVETIDPVV
ncbi:MAG: hypothetical protein J6R04_06795 [Clostridia bacterium]|nr:hypothetical protein [Clostridia bacterium]